MWSMPFGQTHNRYSRRRTDISHLKVAFDQSHPHLVLTPSQQRFVDAFFSGSNVCLTGSAGTGKSFILKLLFDYLDRHHMSVARTALTGIAAFQIGGQTVHSWAGLGLADEHIGSIITGVKKNRRARSRIDATDILFIDEISMAKGDLLNKLDMVLKYFRGTNDPFGGVMVVACGDFLQLAPIFKSGEKVEFAFQSRAWTEASFRVVVLTEPIRQQEGSVLLRVLNDLRVGDTKSLHLLDSRIGAAAPDGDIEPVRIFCHNINVAEYNEGRLAKLPGAPRLYEARDMGSPHYIETLNKNCPAPRELSLKVGAQVILLSNLDVEAGLVNGSVGVVRVFSQNGVTVHFKQGGTRLVERNEWTVKEQEVTLDNKIRYKVVATRSQVPLKLCYAITAHKAQGQTLDYAIVDMTEAFATGQTYCALSRVRDLESLSIIGGIPDRAIRVHPDCVRFYDDQMVKKGI